MLALRLWIICLEDQEVLGLVSILCSQLPADLLLMIPWDPLDYRLLFRDLQHLLENSRPFQFCVMSHVAGSITASIFGDTHLKVVASYS